MLMQLEMGFCSRVNIHVYQKKKSAMARIPLERSISATAQCDIVYVLREADKGCSTI